jgi:hypothetical protein
MNHRMPTDATIDLRPRTAGEVLDDAWRLALADAPLLLALSGLFAVPAAVAVLLLLTLPTPDSLAGRYALPALAALLLPLTGLGSGACQELFRRRAAGERVALGPCLRAALRRGPQHAAGRALTLLGVGLGSLVLALPGLALWASVGTLHAALTTGDGRLFAAFADAARDARRQPAKASAVVLSRLPLLLVAAVNLYLLVAAVLWAAGGPAGLDVAVLEQVLSASNPVYVAALVALAWLALAPYFEASSFLLHLDSRVRYDGLDLAYRVRTLFPAPERGRVPAAVLVLVGLLLCAAPARAEEGAVPRRSREEIKKLAGTDDGKDSARSKAPEQKRSEKDKVRRDDPVEDAPGPHPGGGGGGAVGPQGAGAGLGPSGWLVLGLLALAVLTGALVLFLRSRDPSEPAKAPQTEALPSPGAGGLEPDEQSPGDLWRRAEELARRGDFLEGVRHLYMAVLALLHRADLIRYEKSRTNGEYLRQLRAGGAAVVEPFGRLTRLFEQKWYGERACAADDYDSCLGLASQVRDGAAQ